LRRELGAIFGTRSTAEWVELGLEHDVPIGPVNSPRTSATTHSSSTGCRGSRPIG